MTPFALDQDFAGGGTINHPTNKFDLAGFTNPAPAGVYQTARTGTSTYTIPGFVAGSINTVRLHFAETWATRVGQRVFSVAINGSAVLPSLDIFELVGKNKATIQTFSPPANASGAYVISFTAITNARSSPESRLTERHRAQAEAIARRPTSATRGSRSATPGSSLAPTR